MQEDAEREQALPRVLHCIPTLSGGGAERQLRQLVAHLVERGIKVAIFSRFTREEEEELTGQGATCLPIRSRGNHNPVLALELVRAIRMQRPHIVQSWLPQMDILCGLLGRWTGARWILSERCSPEAYPWTVKHVARRLLGAGADLIIANSRSGLAVWGEQPKTVIPNGIDFERIGRISIGHNGSISPLEGRTVIISVARLTGQKRVDVLIDAMDIVRHRRPDALLLILGHGPNLDQLKMRVAEHGLQDHVHFTGFQPDAIPWLKSADLFASASMFEGHPNSVIEAAAVGIPMVLSDISEHRDCVGEGAWFVPPGDAQQFAQAIVGLIESEALRATVSSKAAEMILPLSSAAAADDYARIYRNLAHGGVPRGGAETAGTETTVDRISPGRIQGRS
jgi:glycosyltransferase involved in cell wall biosynthesis